ncbi:MAG: hypothetical protein M1826_000383 [Phylliscum demangeonii]|nr:MAG: hypothetical protein M1826_000383 [Phylliscum demangeonii]
MTSTTSPRRHRSEVSHDPPVPKISAGSFLHSSRSFVGTKGPASDYQQARQYLREHFDRHPGYYILGPALSLSRRVDEPLAHIDSLPLGYEDSDLAWTLNAVEFQQLEQEFCLKENCDYLRYFYDCARGCLQVCMGPPSGLHEAIPALVRDAIKDVTDTWPDDAAGRYWVAGSWPVFMRAVDEVGQISRTPDLVLEHRPAPVGPFTPWWVLEVAVSQSLPAVSSRMTRILEGSRAVRAGWAVNVRIAAASKGEEARQALGVLGPETDLGVAAAAISQNLATQALGPLCLGTVRLVGRVLGVDVQCWVVDETGTARRSGPSVTASLASFHFRPARCVVGCQTYSCAWHWIE